MKYLFILGDDNEVDNVARYEGNNYEVHTREGGWMNAPWMFGRASGAGGDGWEYKETTEEGALDWLSKRTSEEKKVRKPLEVTLGISREEFMAKAKEWLAQEE